MHIDYIKQRVKDIEEMSVDYEAAHFAEDALMREFIAYVRDFGDERIAMMAHELLKVRELDFPRYCA